MRNTIILWGLFLFVIISAVYAFINSNITMANQLPAQLMPSPVYATVPRGSILYNSCNGRAIDLIVSGSKVEIIKDRSRQWYYIRCKNKLGWVKGESLNIPPDSATEKSQLSEDILLEYANSNLKSTTSHIVWVDIARQRVYVLKNNDNGWFLERTMICSTGKNTSPTLRGSFTIKDRGPWFYSERLGSGAKYWVRYDNSYLFHSVAMDTSQNIIDPTLGKKSSNGCIRLSVEDAKWFYENIEGGSTVEIN